MNTLAKINTVLALILALTYPQTHAQVYKCKSVDGKTTYQQIPCGEGESSEQVKIWAQPSQADIEAAQARLRDEEHAKVQAAHEQDLLNTALANYQASQSPLPIQKQAPTASGPCPPGQVPLNASSFDPSQGWSSSKGYVPLRCGNPRGQNSNRVTQTGPGITEPKRIQDQQGNWYNQPPGSTFATDEKTGKQCFVFGKFVRCD